MSPDYPFRFSCQRSGNCCARPEGRVRITAAEIPAIARCLDLSVKAFRSRFLVAGPDGDWLLKMGLSAACTFLERHEGLATCAIYEARPGHCRAFPFWDELREEGPMLRSALRFCPGLEEDPAQ